MIKKNKIVLGYHSIRKTLPSCTGKEHLYISSADLEYHITTLLDRGYSFTRLRDLFSENERPKAVLTFDDGYSDFFYAALPVLRKFSVPATLFLITSSIKHAAEQASHNSGKIPAENACGITYLNWNQVREIHSSGIEIGSHTVAHKNLTELDDAGLLRELTVSKEMLEKELGGKVSSLCYPYGKTDKRVIEAASKAGYSYGVKVFTSNWKELRHNRSLRYGSGLLIPRIYPNRNRSLFRIQLTPLFDIIFRGNVNE